MPQIEFQPPLATATTIHLPPLPVLPHDPHVLLTFHATPIDGLGQEDLIEIWTDGGSPGTWRAVPFDPVGDGHYVAKISVDVADGSFGYTYRVAHASGDMTWLGDMGGNGKVDLVTAQGDAIWKGEEWLKFDTKEWTGFGVHVDERNVPTAVLIPDSSSPELTFAYLHPSTPYPFATYHPTSNASSSSTAFALLPTSGTALSSTTSTLIPVTQNAAHAPTGPPAAYASYCGLGFSGGEQERTKAFRSLLGLARGSSGFEYVPCSTKEKDGEEVHAVGVICGVENGTDRLVTYVSGDGSAAWDLSGLDVGPSSLALWNAESKYAQLVPASPNPTYQLESSKPVVETLDIVRLFKLSNNGSTVLLGFLDVQGVQWILESERTVVEEITVDEIVQTPVLGASKTLADTSDSGETAESSGTLGFTSGGFSDLGDDTEVTSVEDVEDGATVGKVDPEQEVVITEPEEQEVPQTAELQSAETGATQELDPVVDEPQAPEPASDEPATSTESAPKKSILRFFWITLGFLNSLWWRTVSWFRQWTSEKVVEEVQAEDGVQAVDAEEADEETPLIAEIDRSKGYASTSQQTLVPDVSEPTETAASTKETGATPPVEYETIRVPETRTTVFPAHLCANGVKHDVLLLSSLRDLAGLVAEYKLNEKDADWESVKLVEETVAPESDMSLIKLPMTGEAQVRIRLA